MMTGLQLPNAEFFRSFLGPMCSEEELICIYVTWSKMLRFVVSRCFVRVEELECSVAPFYMVVFEITEEMRRVNGILGRVSMCVVA